MEGEQYCEKCQSGVIHIMESEGLGILMQDDIITELKKSIPLKEAESRKVGLILGTKKGRAEALKEVEEIMKGEIKDFTYPICCEIKDIEMIELQLKKIKKQMTGRNKEAN